MLPVSIGRHILTFSAAATLTFGAAVAYADPPPWAGVWQVKERFHRHDDDDEDYRVVYAAQPRVAEAESLAEIAPTHIPVARGLPFGFNRGTCDRGLVAAGGGVIPVGGPVGRSMGEIDRNCLTGALDYLPDNRQIAWPGEAGEIFRISAERTYPIEGHLCREFTATVTIAGQKQRTIGTACRRSDGRWEILG